MLTPEQRLRTNTDEVAGQVVDGEAILINVATGLYHSLDGAGAVIWPLIAAGHRLDRIAACVADGFGIDPAVARADVVALAESLVAEGIACVDDGDAPTAPPPLDTTSCPTYETPRLQTYHDMSDLLALDPPMPGLGEIPWDEAAA